VAHGISTGGQPALVEGHQEADRAGAGVIALGGGLGALALYESGDLPVQLELWPVDLEGHGVGDALREDLLGGPCAVRPPLREIDHRLLGAAEVERGAATVHRLADGANVRVGVRVEQLKEQGEVRGVALVRRRRQHQDVVRRIAQELAKGVARGLAGRRRPGHAVGLVHNDQVPMNLPQTWQHLGPLGKVERRDDLLLLQPLVDTELIADVAALEDQELLVELLFQFALPLEGEVRRADHKNPLGQAAQLKLPDEQPRHDGLAGPGIIRQ